MNWRRSLVIAVGLMCIVGCGPNMLKTRGRVLKNGTPFLPGEDEVVRVVFVPIFESGQRVEDFYVCRVSKEDGSFEVAGRDLRGMPPGKYRVSIELDKRRSDLLHGAFNWENSPFVFDVDRGTKEIVIDLAKPPNKEAG